MSRLHRLAPVALAILLGLSSSSCFVRKVLIKRKVDPRTGKVLPPMNATRDELSERIERIYNSLNSFQATVDMSPEIGSVYQGQITEYKDVRAFILFRKPADVRILAQYPVVRSTAFDMVSDGASFRFYLVSKNLFVTGSNSAPATSTNKLENLRPDAFLTSMLIHPVWPGLETPVVFDDTDEENALYILLLMRKAANGDLVLGRNVWFDRTDLSIVRQMMFDDNGLILSDTRYSQWQTWNGSILFPAHIDINRPADGYGVTMDVRDMKTNVVLTDAQFQLPQPDGTQLQVIGDVK